ncbi:MAG: DUF1190 domain-containing protein [Hyphomicrobium sp.]
MIRSKWLTLVLAASAALSTGGCGGEEPAAAAPTPAPTERAVFVSAVDCEASGRFSLDDCSSAIETAIRAHEGAAPTYKSLRACEEAEGTDKCERVGERIYRPLLVAFVFENATPPSATPLYHTNDGNPGFRSAGKQLFLGTDDNLMFSKSAKNAYELHIVY